MKQLILIFTLIALSININAQEDKSVTLTVSGQGQTLDEAKQNALRNAIELAFGTFISSNTEILNDELVKDEIVSVSNGNIQKFEVLSEIRIPEGGYATSLKATVSVAKLTTFVESKGVEIEFKGSLFGANIRQNKLNEDAELKAIISLCETSDIILKKALNTSVVAQDPKYINGENKYQIPVSVKLETNENYNLFLAYFVETINGIGMKESEVAKYESLNKNTYKLILKENATSQMSTTIYLRNDLSQVALQNFMIKSNKYLLDFKVETDIKTITPIFDNEDPNEVAYNNNSANKTNILRNSYEVLPEIWHLNAPNNLVGSATSSFRGSKGFPNWIFKGAWSENNWVVFINYLAEMYDVTNFFNSENYYSATKYDYKCRNHPGGFPCSEIQNPTSCSDLIGVLYLDTNLVFYNNYLATFSEEEISKITKISVEQLK